MKKQVIYILTSQSFVGLVKIGVSDNIDEELTKLNSLSDVALPFYVYAIYETEKPLQSLKGILHLSELVASEKVKMPKSCSARQGFLGVSPEKAFDICKQVATLTKDAKKLKRVSVEKSTMPSLKFQQLNIPVGSELTFTKDNSIVCKTVDNDKSVEYGGKRWTLSEFTNIVFMIKYAFKGQIQNEAMYFTYKGTTLSKITEEIYNIKPTVQLSTTADVSEKRKAGRPKKVVAEPVVTQTRDTVTKSIEKKETKPTDKQNRAFFKFSMLDIPIGTTLTFALDEKITCRTIDLESSVEYQGEQYKLSGLAKKILREKYNKNLPGSQGAYFFHYKGEKLSVLRKRMEENSGEKLTKTTPKKVVNVSENKPKPTGEKRAYAPRKEPMTFKMLKIPVGSQLTFVYDEKIVCTTVDDANQVSYQGEIYGLSNLAKRLIATNKGRELAGPQGGYFFRYNGVKLTRIRVLLERSGDIPNTEPIGKRKMENAEKQPKAAVSKSKGKKKAKKEANTRSTRLTFAMLNIPVGSKLRFVNDESVICHTVNDISSVRFQHKEYTLTGLAKKLILDKMGKDMYAPQGGAYFKYKGKKLIDIRKLIESGGNTDSNEEE
jgi:plastocyanin